MKKVLSVIVILLAFSGFDAQSQDFHNFSLGPTVSLKAGVNGGNVYDGRKNRMAFNGIPDFGVSLFYPLGEEYDLGMLFDMGFCTYVYDIIDVGTDKAYHMKYTYFSISSNFFFEGVLLGFNIGYPVMADYGDKIDTDLLNPLTEFRLGYLYPLMMDESATLNVYALGGYMINGIYDDLGKNDPLNKVIHNYNKEDYTNKFNPRVISISLGINYLFNLEF